MLPLLGGMYLGWALGANDTANVFGTAVASKIVTFRKAALICGVAIVLGAVLQGRRGIHTLSGLTEHTSTTLIIVTFVAAATVTMMTLLRLPISTSQAIVGAIAGIGLATDNMDWGGLTKVVICWVATPIGALLVSVVLHRALSALMAVIPMSILLRDKILWAGLLVVGAYGAYALGANNVANATGILSGKLTGFTDLHLALLGGVSIAVGAITFSRRVMVAVGSGIMTLDAFTALVAVISMAVTTHVFAIIGVPVSTSQAIVGAIVGIGFLHGVQRINLRILRNIGTGWLLTPAVSLILSAAAYAVFVR